MKVVRLMARMAWCLVYVTALTVRYAGMWLALAAFIGAFAVAYVNLSVGVEIGVAGTILLALNVLTKALNPAKPKYLQLRINRKEVA